MGKSQWFKGLGILVAGGLTSLAFQNCGQHFVSADFDSAKLSSGLDADPDPGTESPAYSDSKLGINFGTFSTQQAVERIGNTGSWFYNYSPHPNRADSNSTYETVGWANRYGKEFVPMVTGKRFKFGPGDDSCPLIPEFGTGTVCDVNEMQRTLVDVGKLFGPVHKPRYLFTFNEPHLGGSGTTTSEGYGLDPRLAALAFSKIQRAAGGAGLKVLAPSSAVDTPAINWMTDFLKTCHDRQADPTYPCQLEQIHAFNIHAYECSEDFWRRNYGTGGLFRKNLIARLAAYKGFDWSGFVNSRSLWISETNCNWEADVQSAQKLGKFIRSAAETCRRATGQKSGWGSGSLYYLSTAPKEDIERFVWWNTFADPAVNSDTGDVNLSSENRINSVRLLDANSTLTPPGRAYLQAARSVAELKGLDCTDARSVAFMVDRTPLSSPAVVQGPFQFGANFYFGFNDFYCRYPSREAFERIYGFDGHLLTRVVSQLPSSMDNAGDCGPKQGLHRRDGDSFYTYKAGYTCWLETDAKVTAATGLSASQVRMLPQTDFGVYGIKAEKNDSVLCP